MWKLFLSLWKIRIERGYDPAAQDALADLILDGGPDLRKMALHSSTHSLTPSRKLVNAGASILDAPLLEDDEGNLYKQCLALGLWRLLPLNQRRSCKPSCMSG